MFACDKACHSAAIPAGDEGDPAGGITNIPTTECSDPDLMAPAQLFRVFMLEKFREIDAEFQRTMASDGFTDPQKRHSSGASIVTAGQVKYNLGDAIALQILDSAAADPSHSPNPCTTITKEVSIDKSPAEELPSASLPYESTITRYDASGESSMTATITKATFINRSDFAPDNAFVINVRRLIDVQEGLTLLHDLVKNTAIAAITLVAAGSANQLVVTSLAFLPIVFILFHLHEQDWDKLEVEDLKMLLPLLCDDADVRFEGVNPNRLFKAVSVDTSRIPAIFLHFFDVAVFCMLTTEWMIIEFRWRHPPIPNGYVGSGLIAYGAEWIEEEEDLLVMGMQLSVTTLMFILYIIFQYTHWRETSAIMPRRQKATSDDAWDPRRHGTPRSYWLFGMPSMWFTSEESLEKLKKFIAMANPGHSRVARIYPQELAYYALSGDQERIELQAALNESKLFDGRQQEMVFEGGTPEQLDLSLCFFDLQLQHKNFAYPGEFIYYASPEEEQTFESQGSHRAESHVTTMPKKQSKSQHALDAILEGNR